MYLALIGLRIAKHSEVMFDLALIAPHTSLLRHGEVQAQPMTIDDMELNEVNSIYIRQSKLLSLQHHKTN